MTGEVAGAGDLRAGLPRAAFQSDDRIIDSVWRFCKRLSLILAKIYNDKVHILCENSSVNNGVPSILNLSICHWNGRRKGQSLFWFCRQSVQLCLNPRCCFPSLGLASFVCFLSFLFWVALAMVDLFWGYCVLACLAPSFAFLIGDWSCLIQPSQTIASLWLAGKCVKTF